MLNLYTHTIKLNEIYLIEITTIVVAIYCRNVDDLELFSAGVSELPVDGAVVGPTFSCIISKQFRNLKYGDRFWYERNDIQGFTKSK